MGFFAILAGLRDEGIMDNKENENVETRAKVVDEIPKPKQFPFQSSLNKRFIVPEIPRYVPRVPLREIRAFKISDESRVRIALKRAEKEGVWLDNNEED